MPLPEESPEAVLATTTFVESPNLSEEMAEAFGRMLAEKEENAVTVTSAENFEAIEEIHHIDLIDATEADRIRWVARERADQLDKAATEMVALCDTRSQRSDSIASETSELSEHGSPIKTMILNGIFGMRQNSFGSPSIKLSRKSISNANNISLSPSINAAIKAAQDAEAAEKEWEQLAQVAEKNRSRHTELQSGDDRAAMENWKKSDKAAVAAIAEQHRITDEKNQANRIKIKRAANVLRWAARAEADALANILEATRAELSHVHDWHKLASASKNTEAAEEAAKTAEKKWSDLADDEEGIKHIQGEEVVALAKERLATIDREANQREIQKKLECAAKTFFEGDVADWLSLSLDERNFYNNDVKVANADHNCPVKSLLTSTG